MDGMAVMPLTDDMLMMAPPRPSRTRFCSFICRPTAWPHCACITAMCEERHGDIHLEEHAVSDADAFLLPT